MSREKFFKIGKVLAVVLLLASGLLESIYHPGPLDMLNGIAQGLAIFVIWRGGKNEDL
jgi:hypothetical protein